MRNVTYDQIFVVETKLVDVPSYYGLCDKWRVYVDEKGNPITSTERKKANSVAVRLQIEKSHDFGGQKMFQVARYGRNGTLAELMVKKKNEEVCND